MILFQKNSFPISEGGNEFSDEHDLPAAANEIWFDLDCGGNNGLFDGRAESTVLMFAISCSMDGGTTWIQCRHGSRNGEASCPIGKNGQPNCVASWGVVGLTPEQSGIPRKIKIELALAALIPNEKTIQVKNYTVRDDT